MDPQIWTWFTARRTFNTNGKGTSALPDKGDRLVDLGQLSDGRLTAPIAKEPVDAIVISDVHPLKGLSLIGMTKTFQRIYTAKRLGQTTEEAGFTLVKPAHAGVVDPEELIDPLVALGRDIFENETFDGNGRVCATCHRKEENFGLSPAFIATLPPSDPLFVAENDPNLVDLEDPDRLREGLILVNADGFHNPGVFRAPNHLMGLSTSIDAPRCDDPNGCGIGPPGQPPQVVFPYGAQMAVMDITTPDATGFAPVDQFTAYPVERTGWSGDGSPGSGSLHEFPIGAIFQHMPKTLTRAPGVDFRLPTREELEALELLQLTLRRQADIELDNLTFHDSGAAQGKVLFETLDTEGGTVQAGKCALCHSDAGANVGPEFGARVVNFGFPEKTVGNNVFSTGTTSLRPDLQQDSGIGILPLGEGECLTGNFDISGPFPIFIEDPHGSEHRVFVGVTVQPFFQPGLCFDQFNAQPLIEAADTGPFFHNNGAETLEEAIAFYSSPAFNEKPAVQLVMRFTDSAKIGIDLTQESTNNIGRFLRVLNAVENLNQANDLADGSLDTSGAASNDLLDHGILQLKDAKRVLSEVGLHPGAVGLMKTSILFGIIARALPTTGPVRQDLVELMLQLQSTAQLLMVHES